MTTETTEIFAGITPSEEVVLTAVTNLNRGIQIQRSRN